jgi:hypothetical protein
MERRTFSTRSVRPSMRTSCMSTSPSWVPRSIDIMHDFCGPWAPRRPIEGSRQNNYRAPRNAPGVVDASRPAWGRKWISSLRAAGLSSASDDELHGGYIEPVSCDPEPSLRRDAWILKIGNQRLTREIGRLRPKIQKNAPQRLRSISLNSRGCRAHFCRPDMAHRDGTAWLGREA